MQAGAGAHAAARARVEDLVAVLGSVQVVVEGQLLVVVQWENEVVPHVVRGVVGDVEMVRPSTYMNARRSN